MNNILQLSLAALLLFFTACANDTYEGEERDMDTGTITTTTSGSSSGQGYAMSDRFLDQLDDFNEEYLNLADDLVDSDFEDAAEEVQRMKGEWSSIDVGETAERGKAYWMQQSPKWEAALNRMAAATDIESLRIGFSELTNAMTETYRRIGVPDDQLYLIYCPMAFDDKGAYWLSKNRKVRNPYFGDKMLECGSVQETLTEAN